MTRVSSGVRSDRSGRSGHGVCLVTMWHQEAGTWFWSWEGRVPLVAPSVILNANS